MCGIFGLIVKPQSKITEKSLEDILRKIAILSESRGKDSSGITFRNESENNLHIIKGDIPIHELLKNVAFKYELRNSIKAFNQGKVFSAFGHSRLVTNGSQLKEENNQPVLKDDIIIVHNGIIVNVDELWISNKELKREYSIDTEIIPSLIRNDLNNSSDLLSSINNCFKKLTGTFSIATMFQDLNQFVLATNNGSLYFLTDEASFFIFASEEFFLEELTKDYKKILSKKEIFHLTQNTGLVINLSSLKCTKFNLKDESKFLEKDITLNSYTISKSLINNKISKKEVIINPDIYSKNSNDSLLFSFLENNIEVIHNLKRCTSCLLPETFPFIEFDNKGKCNYCRNYKQKNQEQTIDNLLKLIEPYRRKGVETDCLIPFSGGRDSTYSLHFVKKELGLNPIAFTYDWGMVTDLARRNAARVCGKLGVENIIVAANIHQKRENIRKNVLAWLKSPHLGMVPIFMAGDKYFFHYSNKILQQLNLELSIWGSNPLENTDFKSGFTGIKPNFDKKRIDDLKVMNKINLSFYFGKQYIMNPDYFNHSLLDTFGAFKSRYLTKRFGYIQLFDYIKWDESKIDSLILNEYNWEKSIDTKSTWRIGDGTAAFYNYIYYTIAGFSEFDTFRSNQIREGQLTREKALALVNEENIPRYENLRWYLDIIGLDFKTTIQRINQIPKLYNLK